MVYFLHSLFYLFNDSPIRCENFTYIDSTTPSLQFCDHRTRWVEDADVAERVDKIWNAILYLSI